MNNKTYMQKDEFKERQSAFEFFCGEAFEFITEFAKSCKEGWAKVWAKKPSHQEQIEIDFSAKIEFWGTWNESKNRKLFA